MSYYSTDDECEKSMELLPGANNEMVPGTELESTFFFPEMIMMMTVL